MIAHHQICIVELPPRARRIRWGLVCYVQAGGTTSACAENTKPVKTSNPNPRNYLRVRGEYLMFLVWNQNPSELPPRARRILLLRMKPTFLCGTTSACAENTDRMCAIVRAGRNYLRVRGEYSRKNASRVCQMELPPRARRILAQKARISRRQGTTSACAENTHSCRVQHNLCRNYLRVRGEYWLVASSLQGNPELPPRARRIHNV